MFHASHGMHSMGGVKLSREVAHLGITQAAIVVRENG